MVSDRGDLAAFVHQAGPVVTTTQLRQRFSVSAVRWAVDSGVLQRVGHGRYALGTDVETPDEARARGLGGTLSHLSAAVAWELPVWRSPSALTVTVPARARSRAAPSGVRVLRRTLPVADVVGRRTSLVRTALDCAADLPAVEALAVLDSLLRRGTVTYQELQGEAARYCAPVRSRRRAAWFAMLADVRAANPLESVARALALDAGLLVEPQVWIGEPGLRNRMDLVDRRRRIAIETDGHEHHSSRADWARDIRRTTGHTADGWIVLRFTWDDLRRRPRWVWGVMRRVRDRRDAERGW